MEEEGKGKRKKREEFLSNYGLATELSDKPQGPTKVRSVVCFFPQWPQAKRQQGGKASVAGRVKIRLCQQKRNASKEVSRINQCKEREKKSRRSLDIVT